MPASGMAAVDSVTGYAECDAGAGKDLIDQITGRSTSSRYSVMWRLARIDTTT